MSSRLSEELTKLHRDRESDLRDRARKLAETADGRGVAECYARIDEHGLAMSVALAVANTMGADVCPADAGEEKTEPQEELWAGESPRPRILAVLPQEGLLWQLPDSAVPDARAHGFLIGAEAGDDGWIYYAGVGLFPASPHVVGDILRQVAGETP